MFFVQNAIVFWFASDNTTYTFQMPAANVTVTATFEKAALADRLPASGTYDVASLTSHITNSSQTLKEANGKTYSVVSGSVNYALGDALKSATTKPVYASIDVKLPTADARFSLLATNSSGKGNLGPAFHFVASDSAEAATISAPGNDNTITLPTDKWYNVVITASRGSASTGSFSVTVNALNDDDTVNTTAPVSSTGITARNVGSRAWQYVNAFTDNYYPLTGEPRVDNYYMYTDPYYSATVGTNAIEGATVSIKKGTETFATGTTAETTGVYTADKLQAGTYTVEVTKDGYATVTDGSLTVTSEGGTTSVTLTEQSDPLFTVTVNTAPYASVALKAGTSTKGTTVEAQTVTANAAGVATLASVPAGTYTADVTTTNTYLNNATDAAVTVVNTETPVNLPLTYKNANMIFGEDFTPATVGDAAGGYKGITIDSNGGGAFIKNAAATTQATCPGFKNFGGIDGSNFLMVQGWNKNVSAAVTTTETIASAKFDLAFGLVATYSNGAVRDRGNYVVAVKYGDTTLATLTYNSGAPTLTINGQSAIDIKTDQWLDFDVSVSGTTATITVNGIAKDASASSTLVNANTVTVAESVKNITVTSVDANNSNLWGSFGLDNIEIYKVAE